MSLFYSEELKSLDQSILPDIACSKVEYKITTENSLYSTSVQQSETTVLKLDSVHTAEYTIQKRITDSNNLLDKTYDFPEMKRLYSKNRTLSLKTGLS